MKFQIFAFIAVVTFVTNVFAAGFEKNIMWSGRHAGVGGAAVSFVQGSESLYFNPAGLAGRTGGDVSLNISPTFSSFEGAFEDDVQSQSDDATTFPFGATAAYGINEKLGVGVGVYVSGGSQAEYYDVTVSPATTIRPDFKTNLQLIEVSVGAGYEVFDGLKVGAAWRAGFATADFWTAYTVTSPTVALVSAQLKDLSGENFAGFRVGAQYAPSDTWGVGISVRTNLELEMEGTVSGTLAPLPGTTETGLVPSNVTATTNFPLAAALGGHYHLVPNLWHLAAEYVFTQYSVNDAVEVNGTLSGAEVEDVQLRWDDMHNVRLGVEYLGTFMPIRAGYVFTSQVIPESHARPTLSAPGPAHTITLGSGHGFWEKKLMVNGAVEYSFASGDVPATADIDDPAGGTYQNQAFALHLGATYAF